MSDEEGEHEGSAVHQALEIAHMVAGFGELGAHMTHSLPILSKVVGGAGMGLGLGMAAFEFGEDPNQGLCALQESIPLIGLLPLLTGCGLPDSTPPEERRDDMSYPCPEGQSETMVGCFDPNTETFASPEERLRQQEEAAQRAQEEALQQCQ